jgi:hypothetical protein
MSGGYSRLRVNEMPMKQAPTYDAIGARRTRWAVALGSDGLIEETIRVWQPRYGRRLAQRKPL